MLICSMWICVGLCRYVWRFVKWMIIYVLFCVHAEAWVSGYECIDTQFSPLVFVCMFLVVLVSKKWLLLCALIYPPSFYPPPPTSQTTSLTLPFSSIQSETWDEYSTQNNKIIHKNEVYLWGGKGGSCKHTHCATKLNITSFVTMKSVQHVRLTV